MIIDLLNNYTNEEQTIILDTAKRWYAHQYHRSGSNIDLYDEFSNAPYWGDGKCEHGKCETCTHICNILNEDNPLRFVNYFDESDERCEEYSDKDFYEWFDQLISSDERSWIEDIDKKFSKQKELFENNKKWSMLYYTDEKISLKLLTWLNKNNITYCIVKGLLDFEDHLYIKTLQLPIEYYILFTPNPKHFHLNYAVDNYGWVKYNVATLINDTLSFNVTRATVWIINNSSGIIHRDKSYSNTLYFQYEEDAMAVKLRWAEYET